MPVMPCPHGSREHMADLARAVRAPAGSGEAEPPPSSGELCPPVVAAPPRPTVEQVRARAFNRAAVVAALREHFPLHWHSALGRNNGEAQELKALLLVLLGAMEGADVQMHSQCTRPQAQTQASAGFKGAVCVDAAHGNSEEKSKRKCDCYPCSEHLFCVDVDHGHSKQKPKRKTKWRCLR